MPTGCRRRVLHALEKTGATKIAIRLSEKDGSFLLEITDDGAKEGPLTNDPNDLVSKSLQYRARAIHGELCANAFMMERTSVARSLTRHEFQ